MMGREKEEGKNVDQWDKLKEAGLEVVMKIHERLSELKLKESADWGKKKNEIVIKKSYAP